MGKEGDKESARGKERRKLREVSGKGMKAGKENWGGNEGRQGVGRRKGMRKLVLGRERRQVKGNGGGSEGR